MKKILKYIIVSTFTAALLSACNMNLVPINSVTYEEDGQLIQSEASLNALENGMLSSFRAIQMGTYSITSELMMDGFNATLDYGNNWGGIHRATASDFTSSDYDVEDYWAGNYSAIKNYNIFINSADDVDESLEAKRDVVLGEAYFFRAMSYLNLARHFGKAYSSTASTDLCVPLVKVYDQLEKPSRATVEEVYTLIGKDLAEAERLLQSVEGKPASSKPTIDAVYALSARYYLDMGNNEKAAEYAHKVIDAQKYILSDTEEKMIDQFMNDNGNEAIIQLVGNKSTEGTNANDVWTFYTSDPQHDKVFKPYYIPTQKLIDSYEAADLRLKTWFDKSEWVQLNGSYFQGDFYIFTKYWGNPALTNNLRNGRQLPKPLMIGEMYLIAAEAELATDATAAKADLNALQSARGAAATEATTETVRKEWFRETIGEGLRMVTMKRWGIGYSGRPLQSGAANVLNQGRDYELKELPATDYHYCWPIPAHEININKNLKQNPGYSEL